MRRAASLNWQVSLIVIGAITLTALCAVLVGNTIVRSKLLDYQADTLLQTVKQRSEASGFVFVSRNAALANSALESLTSVPDVTAAAFMDEGGAVFASTSAWSSVSANPASGNKLSTRVVQGKDHWLVSVVVEGLEQGDELASFAPGDSTRPLGAVVVAWSPKTLTSALNAAQLLAIVFIVMMGAIAAYVAARLTRARLLPLEVLVQSMQAGAGARSLEQVEPVGADEVRNLATAFNDLISRLQRETARTDAITRFLDAGATIRDRELARVLRQTEMAAASRAESLQTATHDMRTLLQVVLGLVRELEDDLHFLNDAPTVAATVSRLRESTRQLIGRLDVHIRDSADDGPAEVVLEEVNVETVVRSTVDLMEPVAEGIDCQLSVHVSTTLVTARLDVSKFRSILNDLLFNAIKHSTHATVAIHLNGNSDAINIEIRDTGSGMTGEERGRVFEDFYSTGGMAASSALIPGAGLGLGIARRLARMMKGDVTIADTQPGIGTTFVISLPRSIPSRISVD